MRRRLLRQLLPMQTRPSQLRCIVRIGAILLQLLVWAKRNAEYVETQSRVVHETGNAGSTHVCIFATKNDFANRRQSLQEYLAIYHYGSGWCVSAMVSGHAQIEKCYTTHGVGPAA